MNDLGILKPGRAQRDAQSVARRGAPRGRRHGHSTPLRLSAWPAPALAGGLPVDGADGADLDRPRLGFRPPESARGAWISGSIATLVHAAIIAAFAIIAWMAPEVIEEIIIPVQILNEPIEAPGSNQAAPKALAPRRPAATAALAARALQAVPQQAPRPVPTQIPAQALQTAQLDPARVPRQIDRRQLQAQPLAVARNVEAPRAMDIATLSPSQVRRTDVQGPRVVTNAPRAIASNASAAPVAPQAFRNFDSVARNDYASQANSAPQAQAYDPNATSLNGASVALSDRMVGGGGQTIYGTGGDVDSVPCFRSAFVQRYLTVVEERMIARWDIPEGTAPNQAVVLRFNLDASGSATDVSVQEAPNPLLGRSAVIAMRTASPFPPMDDNVRCLSEIGLTGTFSNAL